MKQSYETLVVGATMVGLGYAATHDDVLVIEAGELPAPEWVSSIVSSAPVAPSNEQGKRLAQKLTEYKALGKDVLDVQRLSPALCKVLREEERPVLLLTRIVSVEKTADGFAVELYNNGGLSTVCVKNILDTTPRRLSTPQAQIAPAGKRLHALCGDAPENPALAAQNPAVTGVREPNGLWNVAFEVDPAWDITQARAFAFETWEKKLSQSGARIAIMATVFEEIPGEAAPQVDENWRWLPARGVSDPLTAYEAGGAL